MTRAREGTPGLLERLRAAVGDAPIPVRPGLKVHVTASFGASCHQDGRTPGDLVNQADRALYEAKATGRKTWQADGDPCPTAALEATP